MLGEVYVGQRLIGIVNNDFRIVQGHSMGDNGKCLECGKGPLKIFREGGCFEYKGKIFGQLRDDRSSPDVVDIPEDG